MMLKDNVDFTGITGTKMQGLQSCVGEDDYRTGLQHIVFGVDPFLIG